jgi:hypothetical protein
MRYNLSFFLTTTKLVQCTLHTPSLLRMGNCISSRRRNTTDDESRDTVNSNNILPVAASSGPTGADTFAAAQNITIANSRLFDVRGNYIVVCDNYGAGVLQNTVRTPAL